MKETNITKREIAEMLSQLDPDHAARLRGLYKLWRNPTGNKTLTQWQRAELVRAGLVKEASGGDAATLPEGVPAYCNGAKLAQILTAQFGSLVTSVQISRALRDDGMTGRQPNGQWKVAAALAWWTKNRAKLGQDFAELSARANVAEMEKKISDARRSQVEADEAARQLDAKWILKADAQASCTKTALNYHSIAKRALDRDFSKLVLSRLNEADFTEEQRHKIGAACVEVGREIVNEIADACQSYATPKD